jgi:hypothetical protein
MYDSGASLAICSQKRSMAHWHTGSNRRKPVRFMDTSISPGGIGSSKTYHSSNPAQHSSWVSSGSPGLRLCADCLQHRHPKSTSHCSSLYWSVQHAAIRVRRFRPSKLPVRVCIPCRSADRSSIRRSSFGSTTRRAGSSVIHELCNYRSSCANISRVCPRASCAPIEALFTYLH